MYLLFLDIVQTSVSSSSSPGLTRLGFLKKNQTNVFCEEQGPAWLPHPVEHQRLVKQSVRSTFENWVCFWPQSPFLSSSKRMWISRSPCRSCKDIIDIRICVAQGQQQGTVLKRDLIEFSNLLSSDHAPIQSVQQCRCLAVFKCQMPNACNLPKFAYWVENGPTIKSDSFRSFVYIWPFPLSNNVISIKSYVSKIKVAVCKTLN